MKRLLCIVGGMNAGGAETFLMKLYRQLDKDCYQMDFAVAVEGVYDDEILQLGGKIYFITPKSKNFVNNFLDIKRLTEKHKYQYVMRISQHSFSALELLAARMGGAKTTIFRSSNSSTIGGKTSAVLHKIFIPIANKLSNIKIAPSTEAAEFMYGKNSIKKTNVEFLHNGLDTTVYQYNETDRKNVRRILNLKDQIVIGHVGRFHFQKNHKFLLRVFFEIKKIRKDAILILVGTGGTETEIIELTKTLRLEDSVKFLGIRSDVPRLLSAMDVFVFPSFFEGMPNTVIEAQTSGLPCVIADTITKEANITGLVNYMSLNESPSVWAEETIKVAEKIRDRKQYREIMVKNQYDIKQVVAEFVNIVFNA